LENSVLQRGLPAIRFCEERKRGRGTRAKTGRVEVNRFALG
jgi:hypothetical protein